MRIPLEEGIGGAKAEEIGGETEEDDFTNNSNVFSKLRTLQNGIALRITWDALGLRGERERERERERALANVSASSHVFINSAASEIAMYNI